MKIEIAKSIVLAVLVGISLLLTFGLWTYQPGYEFLNSKYVNEVDIGGIEETKKDLIEPTSIVFHDQGRDFAFSNQEKQVALYRDITTWVLYDFSVTEATEKGIYENKIELIFSDAIPMELLTNLLTFNTEPKLPSWSFQRMYIGFDQERSTLDITFMSVDGRNVANAVVNNSDKYDMLWSFMTDKEGLDEYISVDWTENPFYIPKSEVKMASKSLTVNSIEPNKFVNALFGNPSIVTRNISNNGEAYFADGKVGMRVFPDKRSMEFFFPLDTSYDRMNPVDLLESSISNINDQKGWTDDYYLADIDWKTNTVTYRMRYAGYPIFNYGGLSVIKQQWRSRDIQELLYYSRPLFSLSSSIGGKEVTLSSGEDIISSLENSTNPAYDKSKISEIQIGYRLSYSQETSYIITLEPAWYMKYNGNWQEIPLGDRDKGGS